MKILSAICLVSAAAFITACGGGKNLPTGVQISVVNIAAAPGGTDIYYSIINNTDSLLGYGAYYKIDRLDGEDWIPQPVNEEIAFIDIYYSLTARDTSGVYSIQLYPDLFDYTPGEYRIRKDITVGDQMRTIEALFTLEGERNIKPTVTMALKPSVFEGAPEKISYTIANNTQQTIEFGTYYEIDRLSELEWQGVPFPDGIGFNDIAINSKPGQSYSDEIYLYPKQIGYSAGIYRIRKLLRIGDEQKTVYAHFRVK